jgi:S-adenosylmethionine:tRNA ribosyltransferase-isomerase
MDRVADFDYELPTEFIAQSPAPTRDTSRLLVAERATQRVTHACFHDLVQWLQPGDVVVVNNSKVIPARLRGFKLQTGGEIEVLLLEELEPVTWRALLRPGKRIRAGTRLVFPSSSHSSPALQAVVREKGADGVCVLEFPGVENLVARLETIGDIPLPPYVTRSRTGATAEDRDRYQTVYAAQPGSVAAPTAGLHFTPELLAALRRRGVHVAELTLHVGLGTFAPVKVDRIAEHTMHEETFEIPSDTARLVNAARAERRRVVAVGTTTVRTLEHSALHHHGRVAPGRGRTAIFIRPPFEFQVVGALLTNFHLPCSTLLMLVSAFAAPGRRSGREWILRIYAEAVRERYRFFSYGDAMFLH